MNFGPGIPFLISASTHLDMILVSDWCLRKNNVWRRGADSGVVTTVETT